MTPERYRRLAELFNAAHGLEGADQELLLDRACAGDPALRAEVESLLGCDGNAGRFTVAVAGAVAEDLLATVVAGDETLVGRSIGSYRLTRLIARGGMGAVYEAQQQQPRRRVALKLMRPSFCSPGSLRRFEHEAEILGRLRHPGIAQIHEAGTARTEDGPRPFFAMEFIDGSPLTEYAAARGLDVRQRLDLMARVCDAVQYAHQNGVIHRDLKPANVLVDGSGQPKVLDFGVARATDSDAAVTTMRTEFGQIIGTLTYMSPEQVAGDPRAVDIRSDVYSLGVVTYELLAGRPPHDVRHKTIPEAIRIIGEQEPTTLGSLDRSFRGDIETILAKALEKDKTRRYPSAHELGADLRRYLRDEPIAARPASVLYQLRKFARRNKALVAGVAATFLALAAGLTLATWQAVRAGAAERLAVRQAKNATDMMGFVLSAFLEVDPYKMDSSESRMEPAAFRRALAEQAAEQVGVRFDDEPLAASRLLATLAGVFHSMGDNDRALQLQERALALATGVLGEDHPEVLAMVSVGAVYRQRSGDPFGAEAQARKGLARIRDLRGEDNPQVDFALGNLADILHAANRLDQAADLRREVLHRRRARLGDEHLETAEAKVWLWQTLSTPCEGEPLLREALTTRRRLLGDHHVDVLVTMRCQIDALCVCGRYAEAQSAAEQLLSLARQSVPDEHPETASALHYVAMVSLGSGDYGAAESHFRQVLAIRRRTLGEEHPEARHSLSALARFLKLVGRYEESEALYRQVVAIERQLGEHRPEFANYLYYLAQCLRAKGDDAGLYELLAEASRLHDRARTLPFDDSARAPAYLCLGAVLLGLGQPAAAEPLLREHLEMIRARFGGRHYVTGTARGVLGECLAALGRYDAAEALLLEGYEDWKAGRGPADLGTLESLQRLIGLYEAWGDPQVADAYRALFPRGESSGPEPVDPASVFASGTPTTSP